MNVEAQSVHLMAIIAVYESVCVGAAGVVGGAVPGVGAAALVVRGDRARCRAAVRYGDMSADAGLTTTTPNRPNSIVVVAADTDIVHIAGRGGAVNKHTPVSINLVVIECGVVVLNRGFDGETVVVNRIPI